VVSAHDGRAFAVYGERRWEFFRCREPLYETDRHARGLGEFEFTVEIAPERAGGFIFCEPFDGLARVQSALAHFTHGLGDVIACEMQGVHASAGFETGSQGSAHRCIAERGEEFNADVVEPEQHASGFVTRVAPDPRRGAAENLDHFLLGAVEVFDRDDDSIRSL
jgi:hypothetical protein